MALAYKAKTIERLAKEHEQINWEFRSILKMISMPDKLIDRTIRKHYREVSARIDCTRCGNCCLQMTPVMQRSDIARLGRHFKMQPKQVIDRWLKPCKQIPGHQLKKTPCPFLENKKCTIYQARAHDCRSYPHLHKENFRSRATTAFSNCSVCPIIYHVFTRARKDLMKHLKGTRLTWL